MAFGLIAIRKVMQVKRGEGMPVHNQSKHDYWTPCNAKLRLVGEFQSAESMSHVHYDSDLH